MKRAGGVVVVAAALMMATAGGCREAGRSGTMRVDESELYGDLMGTSRDGVYRSLSFVERSGGPALLGEGNDWERLRAQREPALRWLRQQERLDDLLSAYEEYKRTWSPIFSD